MEKAVITGDIIHSTQLDATTREMLIKMIADMLKYMEKNFAIRSEMYRGDSFQCLLQKPEDALRAALLIKTKIRSWNPSETYDVKKKTGQGKGKSVVLTNWMIDARMAIGVGEVESSKKTLSASSGPAFTLSGHGLDDLKNTKRALAIKTQGDYVDELSTESILLDTIISKTTALQCEVIHLKLSGFSEIEIARKLRIGQSAVNQRSNLGSWHAINAMVERFETIYKKKSTS